MAKSDSLFTKRKAPPKRAGLGSLPEPVQGIAKDVAAGVGELKRQSGQAVENIKSGYRRIKQAIKP